MVFMTEFEKLLKKLINSKEYVEIPSSLSVEVSDMIYSQYAEWENEFTKSIKLTELGIKWANAYLFSNNSG